MRSTCSVLAVVLSVLMAAPRIQASSSGAGASAPQAHIAGQSALDSAVQERAQTTDQDRETVRQFLQRSDVRAIAGKYGIDIRRADSAVATMDAPQLAGVAARARAADEALAGGQKNITISTTAIIIGLLVLILLIVALH